MTAEALRLLLADVASGRAAPDEAARRLAWMPVEDVQFARIDHHRALRQGFPEVIFGQGKTPAQVVAIAERIVEHGDSLLATRLSEEAREALSASVAGVEWCAFGRTAFRPASEPIFRGTRGTVLIVTAGTADLPVAEEAALSARAFGNPVEQLRDVGVAGLHRLLASRDVLLGAAVVIVVAGMEGALPSVVGGLIGAPVIAVPTSIGYGASAGGFAALLGMLGSCAPGLTVVNIDNGFGAAAAASRINLLPPA
ncbi:MAG: nickel pincer cofactor biosynthesis protein LarB [Gemmatimonadota bacterium]|nr:nickel pincer cofactor biosynthesis protein LarB [Gemmatimonadota bacterium]